MPINFNRHFHHERILRTEDTCSAKLHFMGAARQVVGYLELLAANDSQRFVFPSVEDIVKHCGRYQGRKYQKRVVESVLTFLRENLIISEAYMQKRRVGNYRRLVRGFTVYPHDCFFTRKGNRCNFVGGGKLSEIKKQMATERIMKVLEQPNDGSESFGVVRPNTEAVVGVSGAGQGADSGADKGADKGADEMTKGADKGADANGRKVR
jgi:hypothetical protein